MFTHLHLHLNERHSLSDVFCFVTCFCCALAEINLCFGTGTQHVVVSRVGDLNLRCENIQDVDVSHNKRSFPKSPIVTQKLRRDLNSELVQQKFHRDLQSQCVV